MLLIKCCKKIHLISIITFDLLRFRSCASTKKVALDSEEDSQVPWKFHETHLVVVIVEFSEMCQGVCQVFQNSLWKSELMRILKNSFYVLFLSLEIISEMIFAWRGLLAGGGVEERSLKNGCQNGCHNFWCRRAEF